MFPLTVCLCRRAAPDDEAAGRQKSFYIIMKSFRQQHADYCMDRQSQIIIFRVVSGRPDLGLSETVLVGSLPLSCNA
jgi:hypothetical protein